MLAVSGTDIGSRLFSFYEVQVNTSWGRVRDGGCVPVSVSLC